MNKDGKAGHAVNDVYLATLVRAVKRSAAVRMTPPAIMCQENVTASLDGEANDATGVSHLFFLNIKTAVE